MAASRATFALVVASNFFRWNQFASESWDTLRPEIESELGLIDALVMNLVVDMQRFDSAKQVVEQRAREIRHWKGLIESSERIGESEGLVAVVGSKLVNVHERSAFSLLLGHLKGLAQERLEGLEVNFFML